MTAAMESATTSRVGRKKKNFDDQMVARFPEGTFAQIERALQPGETRTDFVQEAVEREVARRQTRDAKGA